MKKYMFCVFIIFIFATPVFAKDIVDMNTASYVQDGDWIYYWNKFDSTLSKVKTNGTENTVLFNKFGSAYPRADICFDEKYIYCSNRVLDNDTHTFKEGIFRISKTDGNPELIYSNSQFRSISYIYNDRMVFTDTNDNLYSIKTDGTDLIELDEAYSHCFVGENGILYYSNYTDTGIYKIDLYGQNKEKISNNKTYYMMVENGWLYYDNRSDDGKMYKMRIDGSDNTKINDDDCYFCTINDGWIYYSSGQEGYSICRINGETLEKQTIVNKGYDNLNVANGYLFFSEDGFNMSMIDVNGGTPTEAILDKTLFGTSEDFEVLIKGKKFAVTDGDTPPMIIDDRVLVPARAFTNDLEIDTTWDEESQTADFICKVNSNYKLCVTVSLTIGSSIMKITKTASTVSNENGIRIESEPWQVSCKEVQLDVPVQTINNRIMVPLRTVAEAFDYKVSWHEDTKTAHVFGWGVDLFTEEANETNPYK